VSLNPKRAAFVREYLIDLNATQAAIRAGYSERTARAQGHRLLTDADIGEAIHKGKAERAERTQVTAEMVVTGLQAIAEGGTSESARVRAYELLGKHIGMFTERSEVTLKQDILVELLDLPDASPTP
jgi:phage terminase small subunit